MSINRRLCIYDFETNGWFNSKNPDSTQPIQVAIKIIDLDGDPNGHDHSTFIKCPTKLPQKIVSLTGITDEILSKKGMDIEKAFARINELVNVPETLIIGHNILGFDNNFMNYYLQKFGYQTLDIRYCFDTYGHFKGHLLRKKRDDGDCPGEYHKLVLHKNYKDVHCTLQDACNYYGIKQDAKFHDARADINYTYAVYKEQEKDHENKLPINQSRLSVQTKLALNKAYKQVVY